MPRRDLTEERTEQILEAYERCVARFGLEGTHLPLEPFAWGLDSI